MKNIMKNIIYIFCAISLPCCAAVMATRDYVDTSVNQRLQTLQQSYFPSVISNTAEAIMRQYEIEPLPIPVPVTQTVNIATIINTNIIVQQTQVYAEYQITTNVNYQINNVTNYTTEIHQDFYLDTNLTKQIVGSTITNMVADTIDQLDASLIMTNVVNNTVSNEIDEIVLSVVDDKLVESIITNNITSRDMGTIITNVATQKSDEIIPARTTDIAIQMIPEIVSGLATNTIEQIAPEIITNVAQSTIYQTTSNIVNHALDENFNFVISNNVLYLYFDDILIWRRSSE